MYKLVHYNRFNNNAKYSAPLFIVCSFLSNDQQDELFILPCCNFKHHSTQEAILYCMWIMWLNVDYGHYDANDQQQCRFIDKALLLLQITNIIKPENFCTSCNMSHCTVLNCLILFSFWQIRALFFWFSSHLLVSKNNPHRSAGTESSLECIFSHQLYYFI